jgi:hypothetical protein
MSTFWFSLALWILLVYGFLSAVTASVVKPDLEHGLNGAWLLLLVVATEPLAVLGCALAQHTGAAPLVFASLAFYLLGATLYVLLSALIFFRWVFRPMYPVEMGASWWINMGAVAIATLAGARLVALPTSDTSVQCTQSAAVAARLRRRDRVSIHKGEPVRGFLTGSWHGRYQSAV